jgi:signal transduction histidine kinase
MLMSLASNGDGHTGYGHAGLGLALADWIVQAHGGHLSVESRVGVGTVFTLSLPLRARPTPGRQPT